MCHVNGSSTVLAWHTDVSIRLSMFCSCCFVIFGDWLIWINLTKPLIQTIQQTINHQQYNRFHIQNILGYRCRTHQVTINQTPSCYLRHFSWGALVPSGAADSGSWAWEANDVAWWIFFKPRFVKIAVKGCQVLAIIGLVQQFTTFWSCGEGLWWLLVLVQICSINCDGCIGNPSKNRPWPAVDGMRLGAVQNYEVPALAAFSTSQRCGAEVYFFNPPAYVVPWWKTAAMEPWKSWFAGWRPQGIHVELQSQLGDETWILKMAHWSMFANKTGDAPVCSMFCQMASYGRMDVILYTLMNIWWNRKPEILWLLVGKLLDARGRVCSWNIIEFLTRFRSFWMNKWFFINKWSQR